MKNLVGARKKGSGLLGVSRGTKRKGEEQLKMKTRLKGNGPSKQQLIRRMFHLFSRKSGDRQEHENVGSASQCSTPNNDAGIELCERKSLIDGEGSGRESSSPNGETSSAVPNIVKERATPVEEDEERTSYHVYDEYFVDTLPAKHGYDSISLNGPEKEGDDGRLRSKSLLSTNSFLDVSLSLRPPGKSLSMPDIQAVENAMGHCDEKNPGVDVNIVNETIADREGVTLSRCETFSSPRSINSAILKRLGDVTLDSHIIGRSLDTLWNRVGKEKKPQDASIILYLLENNANINARDYYGATPLHYAAQRGNVVAVKELLSDPNIDIEVNLIMMCYGAVRIILCSRNKILF